MGPLWCYGCEGLQDLFQLLAANGFPQPMGSRLAPKHYGNTPLPHHSRPQDLTPGAIRKTRPLVAIVVDLYVAEVHAGVIDYAKQAGWILRDRQCYDRDSAHNMPWDGILSIALRPALSDWIRQWKCPVVRMLCGTLPEDAPLVEPDPVRIGAAGARHLLTLGQKKCAYFNFRETGETDRQWRGFEDVMLAAGRKALRLTPPAELLIGRGVQKSKRADVWQWLAGQFRGIEGPLAVMAEDDYFAGDLFEAAAIAGLNIPHDIAIVGEGNRPLVAAVHPVPLSSVDSSYYLIGFTAAGLLDRLMAGGRAPTEPIVVPPGKVVPRASTATYTCPDMALALAIQTIRQEFRNPPRIGELARRVGIPVRALRSAIQAELGQGLHQEIAGLRLNEAKRLLRETDLKLESVAREVGYGSGAYLCRVIQAAHGCSPSEIRRRQFTEGFPTV